MLTYGQCREHDPMKLWLRTSSSKDEMNYDMTSDTSCHILMIIHWIWVDEQI
jgi:hypothetical protein